MALPALVAGVWVDAAHPARFPARPVVAAEVPVSATDRTMFPANNSPTLVADPTDPNLVAAAYRLDAPDFGCALAVSGDGGRGWIPTVPLVALPAGAEKCYAPEVAFDGGGRLYFLFVGLSGTGNRPMGAFLTFSDDRARTFAPPRQVLGPLSFGVRLAVDLEAGAHGRLHLAWLRAGADPGFGGFAAGDNPLMTAYSDDAGATFSEPIRINPPSRARVVGPALTIGPGGAVHVAYYDLGDDARDYQGLGGPTWNGTWSLVVRSSTDRGRRFGPGRVVDADIVPPERVMLVFTMPPPAMAVAPGRLCLAWTDARHGDPDVLTRCSDGAARSWEAPRRLNDDALGNGRRQYLPRLAASSDGRIDAVFYDRRADVVNRLNDVVYTFSEDGGRTFAPNVRLTGDRSNSLIGPQYAVPSAEGQVELGGRLGLLATEGAAVAAWADTRNGTPARTGQDVFATTVAFPGRDGPSWAAATPLLAAAAGALVVVTLWARLRGRRG